MSETLYVIDVFSLVFQVFHGIPAMTSPTGQPTNAIFGFARDVLALIKNKQPTYLVCAMDSPEKGVREELYPEYKANRSAMPDELCPQIPVIVDMIRAFGIPVLQHAGWEADDLLATLADRAEKDGINAVIVTNDKDARQLISPLVRVYNCRKDIFLDAAGVIADWGVRPDQVVDFQSLVGDSVDNVPGVPGIGPKTAAALINQFGSLDEILRRADEVSAKKVKENLKQYAHLARTSKQLVELNRALPMDLEWNVARIGRYDVPRLTQIFQDCGFRRLVDEIKQFSTEPTATPTLFAEGEPAVVVLQTEADFREWLAGLPESTTEMALQFEVDGLDIRESDVVACTLAATDRSAAFVSLDQRKWLGEGGLSPSQFTRILSQHLATTGICLTGHDLKLLCHLWHRANLANGSAIPSEKTVDAPLSPNLGLDTMVGSYLLAAGSRNHSLAGLVERYFGEPFAPLSRVLSQPTDQQTIAKPERLARIAAEEVCLTLRVAARMRDELVVQELTDLYEKLERPLIEVLADMERTGIRVDAEQLAQQNIDITERMQALLVEIHATAGEEFNIDSPKQLREILFEKLKLPVIKKNKTGPSTDQDVLEELAKQHALPQLIIEHRQLSKLKGTYLDTLPTMINPRTGRIHASFNQVVAATGRLSSSNPNLQNIPIRSGDGERIRRAFVAGEPGWQLVCADYSQIELRMLAHFSGDAALQAAFAAGIDVHAAVAAEVFGVRAEEVDANQRRVAKAVNFGVIYGQSPFGLAAALDISREEATVFIDGYFQRYRGVAEFMERTLDETCRRGFAKTILGRRREIAGIRPERVGQLNMPERTAVNTVIQGSAADLIKQAMLNVSARLKHERHPARLLLQIHDELVLESPSESLDTLVSIVREEMEHALSLSVPLRVDIAIGPNWLDAK